jgi:hypothetical protein
VFVKSWPSWSWTTCSPSTTPSPWAKPPDDLPVDDHRIELAAAVVHDRVAQDRELAGLGVDLDDRRVHAARPRHVGGE